MTGKGYEDVNDIGRDVATLGFMGIENIHSVRDSLAAFCTASQAQGQEFYHAVGASGWLRHLSQVAYRFFFVVVKTGTVCCIREGVYNVDAHPNSTSSLALPGIVTNLSRMRLRANVGSRSMWSLVSGR